MKFPKSTNSIYDCQFTNKYDINLLNQRYIHIFIQCSTTVEPQSKIFILFMLNRNNFGLFFFFLF